MYKQLLFYKITLVISNSLLNYSFSNYYSRPYVSDLFRDYGEMNDSRLSERLLKFMFTAALVCRVCFMHRYLSFISPPMHLSVTNDA